MAGNRCIPIKKPLVAYMAEHFPEYSFVGVNGMFYGFTRFCGDGTYEHIVIQREFYEGTISLVLTEVAVCYNRNWRGIPWFTIGYETDIAVLITGSKIYDASTGWRRCENDKNKLNGLFDAIGADIRKYVFPFFHECHQKIGSDKIRKRVCEYLQAELPNLSEETVASIKQHIHEMNQVYSRYMAECRKKGENPTLKVSQMDPLHPQEKSWMTDIQRILGFPALSESAYNRIYGYMIILFRDYYDFYNYS